MVGGVQVVPAAKDTRRLVEDRFATIRQSLIAADQACSNSFRNNSNLSIETIIGDRPASVSQRDYSIGLIYNLILYHTHPNFEVALFVHLAKNGKPEASRLTSICRNIGECLKTMRLFATKWVRSNGAYVAEVNERAMGFYWAECPPNLLMVLTEFFDVIDFASRNSWDMNTVADFRVDARDFRKDKEAEEVVSAYVKDAVVRMAGFVINQCTASINVVYVQCYRHLLSLKTAQLSSAYSGTAWKPLSSPSSAQTAGNAALSKSKSKKKEEPIGALSKPVPNVQDVASSLAQVLQKDNHHYISYSDFVSGRKTEYANSKINADLYEIASNEIDSRTTNLDLAGFSLKDIKDEFNFKASATKGKGAPESPGGVIKFTTEQKKKFDEEIRSYIEEHIEKGDAVSFGKLPVAANVSEKIVEFLRQKGYILVKGNYSFRIGGLESDPLQENPLNGTVDLLALDPHGLLTVVSVCTTLTDSVQPTAAAVFRLMLEASMLKKLFDYETEPLSPEKLVMLVTSAKLGRIAYYEFNYDPEIIRYLATVLYGSIPIKSNGNNNSNTDTGIVSSPSAPARDGANQPSTNGWLRGVLDGVTKSADSDLLRMAREVQMGLSYATTYISLDAFFAFQAAVFGGRAIKDALVGDLLLEIELFSINTRFLPSPRSEPAAAISDSEFKLRAFRNLVNRLYEFATANATGERMHRLPSRLSKNAFETTCLVETLRHVFGPIDVVEDESTDGKPFLNMARSLLRFTGTSSFACISDTYAEDIGDRLFGVNSILELSRDKKEEIRNQKILRKAKALAEIDEDD